MHTLSKGFYEMKEKLFTHPQSGWLWLIVRLYLGKIWILAGYEKLMNPTWIGGEAGGGIMRFVTGALAKTSGPYPDVTGWYAWFLTHFVLTAPVFWSYLITFGEIAVGLGLIFGVLTTFATAGGLLMNFNFLLSGTVSINPIMILLGIPLLLAYRVSGNIGIEKWLFAYLKNKKSKGGVIVTDKRFP